MSATILEQIVASSRWELERRKQQRPLTELKASWQASSAERAQPSGPSRHRLREALVGGPAGVIAEFKRRSPSAGILRPGATLPEMVGAYGRGGAAAISVLTEGPHFGGSLEDLAQARACSELPLLCKDFIIDEYQLYEAQAAGADGVLLIVAALELTALERLLEGAHALGLDALVEVHDHAELEIAGGVGAELVGINNRDLHDFSVDVGRTVELMEDVRPAMTVVSESGISSREQIQALQDLGVSAVLVGESLMRSPDPEATLAGLTQAGAGSQSLL